MLYVFVTQFLLTLYAKKGVYFTLFGLKNILY
jgi:hypothetical protein